MLLYCSCRLAHTSEYRIRWQGRCMVLEILFPLHHRDVVSCVWQLPNWSSSHDSCHDRQRLVEHVSWEADLRAWSCRLGPAKQSGRHGNMEFECIKGQSCNSAKNERRRAGVLSHGGRQGNRWRCEGKLSTSPGAATATRTKRDISQ